MTKLEEHIFEWQKIGSTWNEDDLIDLQRLYKERAPEWAYKLARRDEHEST